MFTLICPLFRVVPGSSGIPRKNKDFLNLYLVDYHILKSKITGQLLGFPGGSVIKNPPANSGDTGSIAGAEGSHMPSSKCKSICHSCRACALEPGTTTTEACKPKSPVALQQEGSPAHHNSSSPHSPPLQESPRRNKDPAEPK